MGGARSPSVIASSISDDPPSDSGAAHADSAVNEDINDLADQLTLFCFEHLGKNVISSASNAIEGDNEHMEALENEFMVRDRRFMQLASN